MFVKRPNRELKAAMQDVLDKKNLSPSYKTAKDAIDAMNEN